MNNFQKNLVDMFRIIAKWLGENLSKLSEVPDIETTLPVFRGYINDIELLDQGSSEVSKGATKEKSTSRENLTIATMTVLKSLNLFATMTDNPGLELEVDYKKYHLDQFSAQKLLTTAELVFGKAHKIKGHELAAKYKVESQNLDELASAIEAFKMTMTAPREKIAVRKSSNMQLEDKIDDANDYLKDKIDVQMGMIEYTQPDLYIVYKNLRRIVG